jgi:hypothetical protein
VSIERGEALTALREIRRRVDAQEIVDGERLFRDMFKIPHEAKLAVRKENPGKRSDLIVNVVGVLFTFRNVVDGASFAFLGAGGNRSIEQRITTPLQFADVLESCLFDGEDES